MGPRRVTRSRLLATLALATGLAAARCGGGLGARDGAAQRSPRSGAPSGDASETAAPAESARAIVRTPDDAGIADPPTVDEQAEANARWLAACAPTVAGQPPVVHVDAPGQGLAFEPIRRVLRRDAAGQVAQCVDDARKGAPRLKGAVLVRFVATPDGTLTGARVLVGPGDDAFHACLVDALRKPKVPKVGEANVTVSGVPVVLCADGRTLLWPARP